MVTTVVSTMSGTQRDAAVWQTLARVPDPEIPVLSIADYGIARPGVKAVSTTHVIDARALSRRDRGASVPCPRCGSMHTREVSRFGSTPCKAQYACDDCLEPFDYFKPH